MLPFHLLNHWNTPQLIDFLTGAPASIGIRELEFSFQVYQRVISQQNQQSQLPSRIAFWHHFFAPTVDSINSIEALPAFMPLNCHFRPLDPSRMLLPESESDYSKKPVYSKEPVTLAECAQNLGQTDNSTILLLAPAGAGKTASQLYLLHHLAEQGSFMPCWLNHQDLDVWSELAQIFQLEAFDKKSEPKVKAYLESHLKSAKVPVVFFANLNEAGNKDEQETWLASLMELMDWLRRNHFTQHRLLLAYRQTPENFAQTLFDQLDGCVDAQVWELQSLEADWIHKRLSKTLVPELLELAKTPLILDMIQLLLEQHNLTKVETLSELLGLLTHQLYQKPIADARAKYRNTKQNLSALTTPPKHEGGYQLPRNWYWLDTIFCQLAVGFGSRTELSQDEVLDVLDSLISEFSQSYSLPHQHEELGQILLGICANSLLQQEQSRWRFGHPLVQDFFQMMYLLYEPKLGGKRKAFQTQPSVLQEIANTVWQQSTQNPGFQIDFFMDTCLHGSQFEQNLTNLQWPIERHFILLSRLHGMNSPYLKPFLRWLEKQVQAMQVTLPDFGWPKSYPRPEDLVQLLLSSLSLSLEEKARIIHQMPELSEYQISKLVEIFKEETNKFTELRHQYSDQVARLKSEKYEERQFLSLISKFLPERKLFLQNLLKLYQALVHLHHHQYPKAKVALERVLDSAPQEKRAWLLLYKLAKQQDDQEQIEATQHQIYDLIGRSGQTNRLLYLDLLQIERLIKNSLEVLILSLEEPDLPAAAKRFEQEYREKIDPQGTALSKAKQALEQKDYPEALREFKNALQYGALDADSYVYLGNVYYDLKQFAQAIEAYEQAIALNPKDATAHYNLGIVYKAQCEYQKAIDAYKQAIAFGPKYAYPWNGLGNVYRAQGEYAQAIEAYKQAIAFGPKYAYPWNGLGNVYRAQGEYAQAIEAYKQAIALDPKDATAHYNLGIAYRAQCEYQKAIEAYKQAIALDPKDATAHYNLGIAYQAQCEYQKAIDAYKQAIAFGPKYAYPWNGLGNVYQDQGEYAQAIDAYKQAIALDPKDANAYGCLSFTYLFAREFESALQMSQKSLSLAPDQAWIKTNLAHAYLFLNQYDQALEIYQAAFGSTTSGGLFEDEVLSDFKAFRTSGLKHPDMSKIEAVICDFKGC